MQCNPEEQKSKLCCSKGQYYILQPIRSEQQFSELLILYLYAIVAHNAHFEHDFSLTNI